MTKNVGFAAFFFAEKIDLFYYNFKNENGLKLSMSAKHEI
jgi:hypothetical protein